MTGSSKSELVEVIPNSVNRKRGVPQGSILSLTLFCLKINSIIKPVCPGIDYSLYMDDLLTCYRSKHIQVIESDKRSPAMSK